MVPFGGYSATMHHTSKSGQDHLGTVQPQSADRSSVPSFLSAPTDPLYHHFRDVTELNGALVIIATYHTGDKGPLSTTVRLILLEILLGSGIPMAFLGRAVLPVALFFLGLAALVGVAFWRVWKVFMPDVDAHNNISVLSLASGQIF
jgi:hypothetical protein